MVDAAVGSKSVLGRAIEKVNLGLPLGSSTFKYIDFDTADLSRNSKENPSAAITGFGGEAQGTPGEVTYESKLKYSMTTDRLLIDLVAMFGKPFSITPLGTPGPGPWLVKIRPGGTIPELRALTMYLFEGGSYTAQLQYGRRCGDISLSNPANKPIEADITYSEPVGDTISGYPGAKAGNTGTANLALIASRGRRPYDANMTAGKSVYLKVVSSTATSVTFVAKFDTPSGGGSFPVAAYGTPNFVVPRAGWGITVDSNDTNATPIGLFGENMEPFEVTIGDQAGTVFSVGDEFEIPATLAALSKVVIQENRLSTFHLTNVIGGNSVLVDSGTTKWTRPFKAYYSNARKFPSAIDPTDYIKGEIQFKKRLFDTLFRSYQEASQRVAVVQSFVFGQPLMLNVHEGVEIYYPKVRTETMKSGDIPNRNVLEETITMMCEQPTSNPAQPTSILTPGGAYFETVPDYTLQINVVTPNDPTFLN